MKQMNNTSKQKYVLYPVSTWEAKKEMYMAFDRVFFTEHSKEVRKIEGTIRNAREITVDGNEKIEIYSLKVRWDGFGRCWSKNSNKRMRECDVQLNSK